MKELRSWTTHEMNTLSNLWGRLSVDDIASELGRSKWSIYAKAKELNLPNAIAGKRGGTTWRKDEEDALRMMRDRGVSTQEMAEALQRGEGAIKRRLSQLD